MGELQLVLTYPAPVLQVSRYPDILTRICKQSTY